VFCVIIIIIIIIKFCSRLTIITYHCGTVVRDNGQPGTKFNYDDYDVDNYDDDQNTAYVLIK